MKSEMFVLVFYPKKQKYQALTLITCQLMILILAFEIYCRWKITRFTQIQFVSVMVFSWLPVSRPRLTFYFCSQNSTLPGSQVAGIC